MERDPGARAFASPDPPLQPRAAVADDGRPGYEGGEPFFEYGHTPDPYAEHLASLDRALALGVVLAFPGHGRIVESPKRRLVAARAMAVESCARVQGGMSERPRTAYEFALELLGERQDPGEQQSMLSVVLSVAEHLEAEGCARGELGADFVRRFRRVPR